MGLYDLALESYDLALQYKPDFPCAHINRGVVLAELGRFEEAIIAYDLALKFEPNSTMAAHNKKIVLKKLTSSNQK
jgi:tetratricopeptide (TPR) repeat protein